MMRSTFALVLVMCGGLAVAACGKKDDAGSTATAAADTAAPADTGTAAPADTGTAAPADTGAPAASGSADAPPAETAAPVANNAMPQRGIEDCCAALASAATRARGKKTKKKSFRALEVCPGIAAQVRSGRSTRASALAQVRSALVGAPVPASCR